MKFIDLFAGIGGFRLGMESAGHECVAFCEIDKFARASYKAIHDTQNETEWHDIREVSDEQFRKFRGTVDVICGGFPCQAFSVAGNRRGFEDTRGTLFFEIARAAKQIQPQYLFLENVKGLLSHDKGETFRVILSTLDELGYDAEWQVLNSKDFGVPQNRERVFIVGHLRGGSTSRIFPIRGENSAISNEKNLEEVAIPILTPDRVEKRQNGRRIKENGDPMFTLTAQDRHGVVLQIGNLIKSDTFGGNPQRGRVYDANGLSPCLNTMQGGGLEPKILQRARGFNKGGEHEVAPPVTSSSYQENNMLLNDYRIRKLTPRECWRLQGFPDWAFDRAQKVNSKSQLYKQAGNSVTVNVICAIAEKMEDQQ